MWCEARRCEKEAQSRRKDASKRAERRKKFYDDVRKGPEQFLHIHGHKATIHTDINITRAAEEGNILRKWQGDPDVTIDRFDARSLIDHISEPKKNVEFSSLEEKEEMVSNYERYRLLVLFEFRKASEKSVFDEIAARESCAEVPLKKADNRKKRQENKTGVHFAYEDSEVLAGGGDDDDSSENEQQEHGMEDRFDATMFSYNTEVQKLANSIGEAYGVKDSHFVALVHAEDKARRDEEELKRIEQEKKRKTGSRSTQGIIRAGLRLQEDSIKGKGSGNEATVKLSSFMRKEKKRLEKEESCSSEEENAPKTEFIFSFGGEEEERRGRGKENRKEHRRSHSRRRRRSRSTSRRRRRESSPRREERDRSLPRSCEKKEEKPSPPRESSDSGGEDALLEMRSSMSDSEKERIEIENRRRRVKRTKRMVKAKQQAPGKEKSPDKEERKTEVEKVKKIMQMSLKKTVEEMKEGEDERRREQRSERRAREELNYLAEQDRRARDRERRRKEGRERSSSRHSSRERKRHRR